ncbi:hypothetical protein [Bacillus cereus]|uniref:hypothetical protein n=1 Tax=Bacillus cereus TaxID=1396 RepID=UPI0027D1EE47|nr:hypothetical protein [Bacillus cereus]
MSMRNHVVVDPNASGFNDEISIGGGNQAAEIVINHAKIINSNHEISEPALVTYLTKFGPIFYKGSIQYENNFCNWFYETF